MIISLKQIFNLWVSLDIACLQVTIAHGFSYGERKVLKIFRKWFSAKFSFDFMPLLTISIAIKGQG